MTSAPHRTAPARTMTPAFRKQMLRQAAFLLLGLLALLLILVGTLGRTGFMITAFFLCPAVALFFNFWQRRLYAAQQQAPKR